jgi:hypothetical protein
MPPPGRRRVTSGPRVCGAAPKGLSKEIATQYETAIKKIWDSAEFKEFMNRRGLDMIYLGRLRGVHEGGQRGQRGAEVARAGEVRE